MKVLCAAAGAANCKKYVEISFLKFLLNMLKTGGRYNNIDKYCPEHLEWISHGRISDNDPTTNTEFNYKK